MLSIPSKILKATVCRNIDNFINEIGLSNENQWWLIKRRSTEGLLTHLTEKWKIALDNENVVGIVFIDFKKAFDCVSHSSIPGLFSLQRMPPPLLFQAIVRVRAIVLLFLGLGLGLGLKC